MAKKRIAAKLKAIKVELQYRKHHRTSEVGAWLWKVVQGYYQLVVNPGNTSAGDLPRNQQGLALVGDARNDTHLLISQLHLAFLHFHNRIVDRIRNAGARPNEVFRCCRSYGALALSMDRLHEFLPLNAGDDLVRDLIENGPKLCRFEGRPFIPVEFSDGAYRFGHAQICDAYDVNARLRDVPIFPTLVGICPVTPKRQVDWQLFFDFENTHRPQPSRRIGPQLVPALMRLPEALVGQTPRPEFASL